MFCGHFFPFNYRTCWNIQLDFEFDCCISTLPHIIQYINLNGVNKTTKNRWSDINTSINGDQIAFFLFKKSYQFRRKCELVFMFVHIFDFDVFFQMTVREERRAQKIAKGNAWRIFLFTCIAKFAYSPWLSRKKRSIIRVRLLCTLRGFLLKEINATGNQRDTSCASCNRTLGSSTEITIERI